MTTTRTTQLEYLEASKIEFFSWENIDSSWQHKINQALIDTENSPYLLFPKNQEELQTIIAQGNQQAWKILPCGQGSKLGWGNLRQDISWVISSQKLNRIIDHAVADLTITVEAGITLGELQNILSSTQQFLPLNPAYPETATIGGIVATADSGSWQQRYGGVRDLLLGLSFVRADGKLVKAGGRVVKNVAGYDMMKLFTGSYGTLGFISQVTLRTYPLPPASQTLILRGKPSNLAQFSQTLISSSLTPTALEIVSPSVLNTLGFEEEIGVIVRFQSISESVQEQSKNLEQWGERLELKSTRYSNFSESELWEKLQTILHQRHSEAAILGKLALLPTQVVSFLELLTQLTPGKGHASINGSRGLGRFYFEKVEEMHILQELRSYCENNRGFLTVLEAPISVKKAIEPWGYPGNALGLMEKIKNKFDPNHIFNPGCFVGKI